MFVGFVCGVGGLAVLSLATVVLAFGRGRLSMTESQKQWLRLWDGSLGSPVPVWAFRRLDAP
jgi:hypothetical protein